jgi:death-on-curing protein
VTILTVSEIILLHEKLITATGGERGIRDKRLLESAVLSCYQTFGGEELYPTVIEKAARMAFAICKSHPFIDGNKRTAIVSMLVLLRIRGISLRYTQAELVELGLKIANSFIEYEEIIMWIYLHR